MLRPFFKVKSIEKLIDEASNTPYSFHKTLGPINLIALGIGCIIGAGIFVITGQAAAQYAGPAIIFSFIISAIACALSALCYAEFVSMIPVAGSAYTYAYATLGEFIAWIIGWDLILEYLFGASSVAVGWSGYLTSFLKDWGIVIPASLSNAPFIHSPAGWQSTGAIINLPAVLIIALLSALLVIGIKESAKFNGFIVILKVTIIILFIAFGFSYINHENWVPFIPENTGEYGRFGWSGVLRGAGVIFFAYIGFDAVSTAAQEAKNPQRDMPIGIIGSLTVATILYILVALVLTGIVKYDRLLVPDPIAVGVDNAGSSLFWLRPVIKIGALAGLSSVILVLLLGQPRIFYSMAKDGLLPKTLGSIHPKYRTPALTTLLTGTVAAIIAGLFPISILGELVSIGTLFAFALVCLGVLVLRFTDPHRKRPFKVPFSPIVPFLGAATAIMQMVALPVDTWVRLIIWMIIGFVIYFGYSRKHSFLRKEQVNKKQKE